MNPKQVAERNMEYIRTTYGVPAYVGRKVVAYGKPGVITGTSGPHLKVRLDGEKQAFPYHPTHGIEYLEH